MEDLGYVLNENLYYYLDQGGQYVILIYIYKFINH